MNEERLSLYEEFRAIPTFAMRGLKEQELLISLLPQERVTTLDYDSFRARYPHDPKCDVPRCPECSDRDAILGLFYQGAKVVRLLPLKR